MVRCVKKVVYHFLRITAVLFMHSPLNLIAPLQIAQATSALIDPRWLPALITCLDGCVLTGVVIMCLRRLQGWSLESLIEEARGVQMASSAAPKGHLYSREVLSSSQKRIKKKSPTHDNHTNPYYMLFYRY